MPVFENGCLDVERGVLDHIPHVELLLPQRHLAACPPRRIHDIFDHAVHLADLPLHDRGGPVGVVRTGSEAYHFHGRQQGRQRLAELVRQGRHEGLSSQALVFECLLGRRAAGGNLVAKPVHRPRQADILND
jgi:hypothetical protein